MFSNVNVDFKNKKNKGKLGITARYDKVKKAPNYNCNLEPFSFTILKLKKKNKKQIGNNNHFGHKL